MTAKEYFLQGFNCAQAVAMAFATEMQIPEQQLAKMLSGFGAGIGRLRETCGAVSGMVFVLNTLYGFDNCTDNKAKSDHYKRIREAVDCFSEQIGSIRCKEILKVAQIGGEPEQRTPEYYKKRSCPELCALAERIIREQIKSE